MSVPRQGLTANPPSTPSGATHARINGLSRQGVFCREFTLNPVPASASASASASSRVSGSTSADAGRIVDLKQHGMAPKRFVI
jgi:hypothetical protein